MNDRLEPEFEGVNVRTLVIVATILEAVIIVAFVLVRILR